MDRVQRRRGLSQSRFARAGSIVLAGILMTVGPFAPSTGVAVAVDSGCAADSGYAGGDGTSGDPYEIASEDQLYLLKTSPGHWAAAFELVANIDMVGCIWDSGIGTAAANFTGTFDGGNFTINNLTVAVSGDYSANPNDGVAGLFGVVNSPADIRNLDVSGSVSADITSTGPDSDRAFAFAGGIVGKASQATITDVNFTGKVTALSDRNHAYAGGIAGLTSQTTLTRVSAGASVTTVADGRPGSGGLVGELKDSSTITDSWAVGSVYSDGTAQSTAGGIAGYGWTGAITRVYANALVTAMPALQPSAGGILGMGETDIVDSYARGTVWGSDFTGGLVGWLKQGDPQWLIERSYYSGTIGNRYTTSALGGIGGQQFTTAGVNLITSHTFWDVDVTGLSVPVGYSEAQPNANPPVPGVLNPPVIGATGESTADMKRLATFANATWDIGSGYDPTKTWSICPDYNDGYPFLTNLVPANPDPCLGAVSPSLGPANQTISGVQGDSVTTSALSAVGFTGTPVYSVTPPLPAGLSMNPLTGKVTGVVATSGPERTYTITAATGSPYQQASVTLTQTAAVPQTGQLSEFVSNVLDDGAWQAVATRPTDGYSLVVSYGNAVNGQGNFFDSFFGYLVDPRGDVASGSITVVPSEVGIGAYSQPAVAYNPVTGGWLLCYAQLLPGNLTQPMCQYINPDGTQSGPAFAINGQFIDRNNQTAIAFDTSRQDFLVAATAYSRGPVVRFVDGAGAGALEPSVTIPTAGGISPTVTQQGGLDLAYATQSGTFGLVMRGRVTSLEQSAPWFFHLGSDGIPTTAPHRLLDDTSLSMTTGSIAYDTVTERFMVVGFDSTTSGVPLIAQPYDAVTGTAVGAPVSTVIDSALFGEWGYRPSISAHSEASEFLVVTPMRALADNALGVWSLTLDGTGSASAPVQVAGSAAAETGYRPRVAFNEDTCEYVATYNQNSSSWGWQLFLSDVSPSAPCTSSLPPTAPLNATAVAGSTNAAVSWQAPASSGSSAITSYEVTASPAGAACTAIAPALTCTVTGLTNGTSYTFRVRAENDSGWGAYSQPSNAVTPSSATPTPVPGPATPASAPRDVRAEADVESAKVTWLPPESTGTFPVTSYQAVASPGGQACLVTAPGLTCTINGLTPGSPYTVTARALTGAGWGATSTRSEVVVPLAPPTPAPTATILITSSRDRAQKSMARIEGTTTGLVGAEVVPYLRTAGQTDFKPGASTRTVKADGNFVWQRKAKKRFTVYFVSGDVTSNRLVIRPE